MKHESAESAERTLSCQGRLLGEEGAKGTFPSNCRKIPPLYFCISLSPPNTPANDTPDHLESPLTTLAGTDIMSQ